MALFNSIPPFCFLTSPNFIKQIEEIKKRRLKENVLPGWAERYISGRFAPDLRIFSLKTKNYPHHHPANGTYKFYENGSTETFRKEELRKAGCSLRAKCQNGLNSG
jgi:hypothetical protein